MLKRQGYNVEDHVLKTREEVDAFKKEHNVSTAPQAFIDGKRIGGYEDVKKFLGKPLPDKNKTSYVTIAAIFVMTFIMAIGSC